MTELRIDEPTLRQIMDYYRIRNHDVVTKYVKSLGIEHKDTAQGRYSPT